MPNFNEHVFWSEYYLGLRCERVHRALDVFARTKGSQHRDYFHDPLSASLVANRLEGPHCIPAALNHLLVDEFYADPDMKAAMELVRLTSPEKARPEPAPMDIGKCFLNQIP